MPTPPSDSPATSAMTSALQARFGSSARAKEPLARHGTFAVGGPADAWVPVRDEPQLRDLVRMAQAHDWPLMLVGNGTNVLYADAGARGVVARMLNEHWRVERVDADHTRLTAGAGVNLPKLVNALAASGLAGLEWAAGVPGTIGGGVVSNAGAHGMCIADTLESARVLFAHQPDAPIRDLPAADLDLAYRHSRFRAARRVSFDDAGHPSAATRARIEPPEIITAATFILRHDEPAAVLARVAQYKQHRKDTQPPQASAGSVFKNPAGTFSGKLIEEAGLKGHQLGGAQISAKHANFIINTGGATAADVVGLIALARRTVRERFGIELELEVELRGDW